MKRGLATQPLRKALSESSTHPRPRARPAEAAGRGTPPQVAAELKELEEWDSGSAGPPASASAYYAKFQGGFEGVFASSDNFKHGIVGLIGPTPAPADAMELVRGRGSPPLPLPDAHSSRLPSNQVCSMPPTRKRAVHREHCNVTSGFGASDEVFTTKK